jgi:tRNA pseudouridine38-40 synthase
VRLKLTLEYDGSGFHGWAEQPGLRTVQGSVRAALDRVYANWERLAVAGRTDAGVHALGQVASVEVEKGPPAERAAAALNAELPDDVSILAVEEAARDFHARHSALSRSYRYRIWTGRTPSPFERRRALWHPGPVDEIHLAASASLLLGEHDFRAFTPTDTEHEVFVRTVAHAAWAREGESVLAF